MRYNGDSGNVAPSAFSSSRDLDGISEVAGVTNLWTFRIVAFAICIAMGTISVINLAGELMRPPPSAFPDGSISIPSPSEIDQARRAARIAPDRSDLRSNVALALAAEALHGPAGYRSDLNQQAQMAAREALGGAPLDSGVWLVLARLQAQVALRDPRIAETLKLSYFTGPNLRNLVSTRLATVVSSDGLNDPDLKELARGDVRLVLINHPDLKPGLVAAYRGAGPAGKQFLEESIKSIDPKFITSLPGGLR